MKGALIILAVTVVFGLVLYITHTIGEKRRKAKGIEEPEETPAADNGGGGPGPAGWMSCTARRASPTTIPANWGAEAAFTTSRAP